MEIAEHATVAVIGAGTMGAGIAQVAAAAGHPVLLYDATDGAARAGIERTAQALGKRVDKGKLEASVRDALLARIQVAGSLEALEPAALVIEAIVENLEVKQRVFATLEKIVDDESIFASNTSSLSITALGAGLRRPERLLGMHFFNPAPVMRLVEVIHGLATDQEIAAAVAALVRNWGKEPVQARSTPGFIVNRVARPFYAEALRVVEECAADPATVDAVLREAGGFRMGPFELMDLIGHDVNFEVTRSMFRTCFNDPRYLPSLLQQELVLAGRLGRKSGRGFYSYSEGAERPRPHTAGAVGPPEKIRVGKLSAPVKGLRALLEEYGLAFDDNEGDGIELEGTGGQRVRVNLSDGRSATQRAAESAVANVVVYDLALDFARTERIALATADQADPSAVSVATGLFQAIGKQVSVLDDIPGLVLTRTLAMLVNEAADALNHGVCSASDLDTAMERGVNYPRGPLAWAEAVGLEYVLRVTRNLAASYGEDRYRVAPLLSRRVQSGRGFHSERSES